MKYIKLDFKEKKVDLVIDELEPEVTETYEQKKERKEKERKEHNRKAAELFNLKPKPKKK